MISLQKSNIQIVQTTITHLMISLCHCRKGTLFIFVQNTKKVVSNQITVTCYQNTFLSLSISLGLTNHFRDLEDQTKNLNLILLKRYNFQKKLLVEVTILLL
jgi:hypothetical protein